MVFDLSAMQYGGLLGLQSPSKPIKRESVDLTSIYLHGGENEEQYTTFLEAASALAQMFKFMTPGNQALIKTGLGSAYRNMDIYADADEWNLIADERLNTDEESILADINKYFNWDSIKNIGADKTYFELATETDGAFSTMTDEDAFYLMCSMLESRQRVYSIFTKMFGDPSGLTDDATVIDNFSKWFESYANVDTHNLSILSMFFQIQSSFINSLDSYVNCGSYWGDALETAPETLDLGTFSLDLMTKVKSYIATLTDADTKDAADRLMAMWDTPSDRWDSVMVDGEVKWTGELDGVEGSWVKNFNDAMDEISSKDVIRNVIARTFNRSEDAKYKRETTIYEDKKDDYIQNEQFLQKMSAKKTAVNKQAFAALLKRRGASSKLSGSKKTRKSLATRSKSASPKTSKASNVQAKNRVSQASASVKAKSSNFSAAAMAAAAKNKTPRVSPSAAKQQASKKNEKKVI
jgi:hypothetical protein